MDDTTKHDLTIERVFNATLDNVWSAWTDPMQIQQWWGPNGVTIPTCTWQALPGGQIHIVMLAGPDLGEMSGQEWPMTGEFKEVLPKQQLVFTSSAIMDGKPVLETLCTIMFEDMGDKTKLNLHIAVTKTTPEAAGPLAGMEIGWNQSIDKLNNFVSK